MSVTLVDSNGLFTCRICLQSIPQKGKAFYIFNSTKESLVLRLQLTSLAPKMDLNLISDPVICINCKSTLQVLCMFRKKCHDSDKIVKSAVQTYKQMRTVQDRRENRQKPDQDQTPNSDDEVGLEEEPVIDIPHLISCAVRLEYLPDYVNTTQKALVRKKNDSDDYNIYPFPKLKTEIVRENSTIKILENHKVNNMKYYRTKENNIKEPNYKCNMCSYVTNTRQVYESHLFVHKFPTKLRCTSCNFISVVKQNFDRHMEQHKSNKILKPNKPIFTGVQEADERNNTENYHTKETDFNKAYFKCNICAYSSNNWRIYQCHLMAHNSPIQLQCIVCNYISLNKSSYTAHIKRHKAAKIPKRLLKRRNVTSDIKNCQLKETNVQKAKIKESNFNKGHFKCNMCLYSSNNWRLYRSHLISHESPTQMQCTFCYSIATNKYSFVEHMKRHKINKILKYKMPIVRATNGNTEEDRTVGCRLCPFKAKSEKGLKSHTRIHE